MKYGLTRALSVQYQCHDEPVAVSFRSYHRTWVWRVTRIDQGPPRRSESAPCPQISVIAACMIGRPDLLSALIPSVGLHRQYHVSNHPNSISSSEPREADRQAARQMHEATISIISAHPFALRLRYLHSGMRTQIDCTSCPVEEQSLLR
jgi:hypothetical protein